MLDHLIASSHRSAYRPLVPSSTVAVLLHAGVCVAAAFALRPHRTSGGERPPLVISWPLPSEERSHADRLDQIVGPPTSPIDVPPQAPIGLPPIDTRLPFDAKLLLRSAGDTSGDGGANGFPDGPWSPAAVDDPPVLVAGPQLAYPEMLRRNGTDGTVVVQAVIDTLGHAEPGSLVLQSSHTGFEAAARAFVLSAVFRPGRTQGRAVRVLVRLPISFTLTPTH